MLIKYLYVKTLTHTFSSPIPELIQHYLVLDFVSLLIHLPNWVGYVMYNSVVLCSSTNQTYLPHNNLDFSVMGFGWICAFQFNPFSIQKPTWFSSPSPRVFILLTHFFVYEMKTFRLMMLLLHTTYICNSTFITEICKDTLSRIKIHFSHTIYSTIQNYNQH